MTAATAEKNGRATAAKKATTKEKAPSTQEIQIPQLDFRPVVLTIQGTSPLIMNRWSEKAMKQIEDKQTGKAAQKKAARNPEAEYKDAAYVVTGGEDLPDWEPGKYFFPASAFKHAFLFGVAQLNDVKTFPKTRATGWFFPTLDEPVLGFDSVTLRKGDIGRNPTRPLYRPQFNNWRIDLPIEYEAFSITLEQVIAILDRGLQMGGIGEWRPSAPTNKTGMFGRARVAGAREGTL